MPTAVTTAGQVAGGHAYTRTCYQGPDGATLAERWTIHRGGHAWSGGVPMAPPPTPAGPTPAPSSPAFSASTPSPGRSADRNCASAGRGPADVTDRLAIGSDSQRPSFAPPYTATVATRRQRFVLGAGFDVWTPPPGQCLESVALAVPFSFRWRRYVPD